MAVQAELDRVTAERDAAQRVAEEAMRIMDDAQLAELKRRMDRIGRGEEPGGC